MKKNGVEQTSKTLEKVASESRCRTSNHLYNRNNRAAIKKKSVQRMQQNYLPIEEYQKIK